VDSRRGFIGKMLGGAAAIVSAQVLPKAASVTSQGLVFHPDAFSLVMKPIDMDFDQLRSRYIKPAIEHLVKSHDAEVEREFIASGLLQG